MVCLQRLKHWRRGSIGDSIQVLRADGAHLSSDELPQLSFVARWALSGVAMVTGACGRVCSNRAKTPKGLVLSGRVLQRFASAAGWADVGIIRIVPIVHLVLLVLTASSPVDLRCL
jgi:hypothetical protein